MRLNDIIFLNKDYKFVKGSLTVENNVITDIEEYEATNEKGIIPPFTDIHIHGGYGIDVMDCDSEGIKYLAERLLNDNVGMWLPTTVAKDYDTIINCAKAVKKASLNNSGAEIAGIHIEGPFISKEYKGIMEEKYITGCDISLFDSIKEIMGDMVVRFTVAPEVEAAKEFCRYVTENGGFVSMGHSKATKEECQSLINCGANSYTHLFNAMAHLHHREENIISTALTGNEYCEIIADEIHIAPDILKIAFNILADRAVLITDALRPMGMGDGSFEFCGDEITVKNKKAINKYGRLAGSVIKMSDAVENISKIAGYEKALKYACENSARAINKFSNIGSIEVGKRLYCN